jgi:hypothetical protein
MAKTSTLQEIRKLLDDGEPRQSWRLHTFSEEAAAAIQEDIADGETAFKTALRLFGEGNREGAVAALKHATASAERAIEAIEA